MSLVLLVLTHTDASALTGIAAHFTTLNRDVLSPLYFLSFLFVSGSELVCDTAKASGNCVYSEIIVTGEDQMGTIRGEYSFEKSIDE